MLVLLLGGNFGKIDNINTSGCVIGTSKNYSNYGDTNAGGIAGCNSLNAEIVNCCNECTVFGSRSTGGITGVNIGNITDCINKGNISELKNSTDGYIGGIAGWSNSNIRGCCNIGTIIGTHRIGGIVAVLKLENEELTLINSYNVGNISGDSEVGGIAGSSFVKSCILNCYNVGNIDGKSFVGGIVGNTENNKSLSNNYWLSTCGTNYGAGSTNSNANAESKTSTELKALASRLGTAYTPDTNNINNGYPILTWQK